MKDYFKYFDKFSFIMLLVLSIVGILFIYSSSHHSHNSAYLKQLIWLVVSLLVFFALLTVKVEIFFRFALLANVVLAVSLVLLFLLGRSVAGARSWLRLGFFSVQFSEFVKVPLALYLAKFLCQFEEITARVFLKLVALIAVPVALIVLQPDFGVSFVLCSYLLMVFLLKRSRLAVVIATLAIGSAVLLAGWHFLLKDYQRDRIVSFINPGKYSGSIGYQVNQSKIAIGAGGLLGKGYLRGSQSQFQFLPTRHTDFIISVIGEEVGFFSIGLLFILYFVFFYQQFKSKFQGDEEFYFVFLFTGLIVFQFLINVLMAVGLFPVLGIPLPFVSYGGSSLLAFFIGEAIVFKIKISNFLP